MEEGSNWGEAGPEDNNHLSGDTPQAHRQKCDTARPRELYLWNKEWQSNIPSQSQRWENAQNSKDQGILGIILWIKIKKILGNKEYILNNIWQLEDDLKTSLGCNISAVGLDVQSSITVFVNTLLVVTSRNDGQGGELLHLSQSAGVSAETLLQNYRARR